MRHEFILDSVHKRLDYPLDNGYEAFSDYSQTIPSRIMSLLTQSVLVKDVNKLTCKARQAKCVKLCRVQIGVLLRGGGRGEESGS